MEATTVTCAVVLRAESSLNVLEMTELPLCTEPRVIVDALFPCVCTFNTMFELTVKVTALESRAMRDPGWVILMEIRTSTAFPAH